MIYQSANGCDSTYCFSLNVLENNTYLQESICEGEIYEFNNQELSQPGTYTASFPGSNDCDSLIFLELVVEPLPIIDLSAIGSFCINETVQLIGGVHSVYLWSNGAVSDKITINSGGDYQLTVTNDAGCSNSGSIFISEEMVDFNFTIIPPSCFEEKDAQIIIDSVWGGQPPYLFRINEEPFQQSPFFVNLEAGNITIVVEDVEECRQEINAQITAPIESILELGQNIELALGDSIELEAVINFTPSIIHWTPKQGLNCDTCLSVVARPFTSTTYEITAIDSNNCTVTSNIHLTINRQKGAYIPSAFSPNNDGINDEFTIYGNSSITTIQSFRIFNRWGGTIFEVSNIPHSVPSQGWSGLINGKPAANGVYVYQIEVIRLDGEMEFFSGDLLLIR